MNKVLEFMRRVRGFLADVRNELKKSTWPTRSELIESTVVVIISVILFTIFIGLSDTILSKFVSLLGR